MSHDQPEAPRPIAFAGARLPLLVAVIVAATAATLAVLRDAQPVSNAVSLPLWFAVALFACSSLLYVDIPTRTDAHTVTLSDLPIVVALFFLSPVGAVAAHLVGSFLVFVAVFRQRGVKLAFNVAQTGLQTLVAVVVFRAVLMHANPDGVRAWLAALVAMLAADMLSAVLVTLAVWLHSHSFNRDLTIWALFTGGTAVLAKTALALLAVVVLQHDTPSALGLLAIVTALMYAAYRTYSHLYLRHQRVEKLYRFTNAVAGSVELSDVAELAVREARELLDAHAAELVLLGSTNLVVGHDEDGPLVRTSVENVDASVLAYFNDQVRIIEIERGAALDGWLDAREWEYALAASLGGDNGDGWIAVARGASDEPFGAADLQLFEAIATQASVALENGRLLDALSHAARLREHRALHDPLTELPNRVQLTDTLTSAIEAAGDDMRFALLVVGLDDFRDINETLGHDHGDVVLRGVADRLLELADGGWTTARLGGDEFAILVPDSRGIGAAVRTAEGIARAFEEQPFHAAGLVIEVGVSVGVAMHPDHGTSAQQLLRRAEIAMRAAKGRHARVNSFIPSDDPHSPRQLGLAHELRQALERDELAIFVQPQLDLTSNIVSGVEVLVRWRRDDGSYLPPDEFIPVAERTGLIRPLTQYVLERSLEHRRQWVAAGYDVDIAVNVSVRDLVDPAFPEQVAVALTRSVCPAHALTLEITETQIMAEPDRVAAALRRLAVLGVKIAIDDFGTGYSSLSSVRALAVDEIKIDKSFVQNAADDEQDGTLCRSITSLGHGLGLKVVAEGSEDQRTIELLRQIGVDSAQGFSIARPMPAIELPGWLASMDERVLRDRSRR